MFRRVYFKDFISSCFSEVFYNELCRFGANLQGNEPSKYLANSCISNKLVSLFNSFCKINRILFAVMTV